MADESTARKAVSPPPARRPVIAFFDYPDVFEDFYPHYGVDQAAFATSWAATGNHAFVALLQRVVGDVVWYSFSLAPQLSTARHEATGCQTRILRSSWLHRTLWRAFYLPRAAWRWRRAYPLFAFVASYMSLLTWPLVAALRRDRPDFIFVQDYATGRFDVLVLLARMLRVPLIAYHSGSDPERYIGKRAKRWTIPRASRILASSHAEAEMLRTRYRVMPDRIRVVLTPIDTRVFRIVDRASACEHIGLDPRRRYVLFVGRLDDRVKRLSVAIHAFAAVAAVHPDVDFLIVGEGRDREALRALAAEAAGERVRFLGWVKGKTELASLYNGAECLLLPSRSEGFPTVIGEAMLCGLPVVATNVGGVGELVRDGESGFLIPQDGSGIAERLAHVLGDGALQARLSLGARRAAEARLAPAVLSAQLRECFEGSPTGLAVRQAATQ